eukprot:5646351-Pleurochrysis_carterae.AAC.1
MDGVTIDTTAAGKGNAQAAEKDATRAVATSVETAPHRRTRCQMSSSRRWWGAVEGASARSRRSTACCAWRSRTRPSATFPA